MDCKNNPCCGDRLSCFGKPKPKFDAALAKPASSPAGGREAVLAALRQAASGGASGLADHEIEEIANDLLASLSPSTSAAEPVAWTVESLAQWLHDEAEHQESYPHHHWPEHPDDDGNRDGGFVKIVPKHAQAYFRQLAARCLGIRPFSGKYFEAIGATPPAPAAVDGQRVKVRDWLAVARAAGQHGVRYRTNRALEAFLSEIRACLAAEEQADV
jgi:hypothetical protein